VAAGAGAPAAGADAGADDGADDNSSAAAAAVAAAACYYATANDDDDDYDDDDDDHTPAADSAQRQEVVCDVCQRLVLKHVSGVRWADGRLGRLEGERLCLLCHRRLLDDILEYDVPAWLDAPAWNALSPPPVANVTASAFGWLYDGARDAVSAYTAADGHALVASVVGMSIPGAPQTPAAPPPIMVQTRPPRHARKGSTPPPHPPSPPSLLRPSAMDMNLDAID
jgi:hypothetical protein